MSDSERRRATAIIVGATVLAVVVPLWFMFSHLFQLLPAGPHSDLATGAAGLLAMATVLAVPAYLWARVVAAVLGADRGAVVRATLRSAVPTAIVVGIAVDLSQLFIDDVEPWHDIAVHVLFTVAFSLGVGAFLAVVGSRVARAVRAGTGPAPTVDRSWWGVLGSTTMGVVVGSGIALLVDWEVHPWMGMRMLRPLYLVLVTGSAAGGLALARQLVAAAAGLSAAGPKAAGPRAAAVS